MSVISLGFISYALGFIGLIGLLWVIDRAFSVKHRWHVSRPRLMACPRCRHVFLANRHQLVCKCPKCGEKSEAFRMPQSGKQGLGGF